MEPITIKISATKDEVIVEITAEIRQLKTIYTIDGYECEGINRLLLQFAEPERVRVHILQEERAALLRHYAAASTPRTVDSLLVELSDRGVETTMLRIPCITPKCDEVAIEEAEAPLRLDEVSVIAEESSGFVEGRCDGCHRQEMQENKEEDIARERHEAREDAYNE
jgi:hypothetical protein